MDERTQTAEGIADWFRSAAAIGSSHRFADSTLLAMADTLDGHSKSVMLPAILRIIDSCGGEKAHDESRDHHAGYNAALDAVEREMKRAWPRITEILK